MVIVRATIPTLAQRIDLTLFPASHRHFTLCSSARDIRLLCFHILTESASYVVNLLKWIDYKALITHQMITRSMPWFLHRGPYSYSS
jgi:hypothetical protein